MKKMKKIIILSALIVITFNINAQDVKVTQLATKEQSLALNLGMLDYSTLTTELSYKRGVRIFNKNFIFGTDIAVPIFTPDFNDLRFRVITVQTNLIQKGNFDLSLQFAPTIITSKTKVHKILALGETVSIISGFYGKKWGGSFTVNAEFMNASKIEHTDYYKKVVYENVYDGWLKSPTNNLRLSLKVIRKIKNLEASLSLGYGRTFKNSYMLFPPISGILGFNYVF